jgi:hypothetical protein
MTSSNSSNNSSNSSGSKRSKIEKEYMEKYGGVVFVVSKKEHFRKAIGNEASAIIYDGDTQGYKSNWFDFNMDTPGGVMLLQECEKALSDVKMDVVSGNVRDTSFILYFGLGQPSKPLINRLRSTIKEKSNIAREQIAKHHTIYLAGFSSRLENVLFNDDDESGGGKCSDFGRYISDELNKKGLL